MARFKALTAVALMVMMLIVIGQNTDAVETRFLLWHVTLPRALLLMITLIVGFALGVLWSLRLRSRSSMETD